jgi:hypothetical protein
MGRLTEDSEGRFVKPIGSAGACRLGWLRALLDAYLLPSKVWIRLELEAEERLQRYSRGERV